MSGDFDEERAEGPLEASKPAEAASKDEPEAGKPEAQEKG